MKRMLVLLSLLLAFTLTSTPAMTEEIDSPPSTSQLRPPPAPAIGDLHLGATSGHITPRLPFGEPTSLLMQLRNFSTGEVLTSGWESNLWERGKWQYNLSPNRRYCYQARARNILGEESDWGLMKCTYTGTHYYLHLTTPADGQYVTHEIALPDLDGDGHLDFFAAISDDEDEPTLFAQQPIGTFTNVTPVQLLELSKSVIFGDWDNDGDADAYKRDSVFLRNEGAPSFTDLSANVVSALPPAWSGRDPQAWVDLDGDGYLEIFVTSSTETRALKKSGANGFTLLAGATLTGFNFIGSIDFADHDLDGDADLCVTDINGIHIYENNGAGTLSLIAPGAVLTGRNAACWGDVNHDGWPDLAMSSVANGVEIAINQGNGTYVIDSSRIVGDPLLPEPNGSSSSSAQGFDWCDADNDGDMDLLVQRGAETGTTLCRNDGNGVLYAPDDCHPELLCRLDLDIDIVTGDLNEDGILDVFRPGTAISYGMQGVETSGNNWVILHLIGSPPSNRMAVGARVRVTVGNHVQYRQLWATAQRGSQPSPFVHFGLGDASLIDELAIKWPSGSEDHYENLLVNQRYSMTEGVIVTEVDPQRPSTSLASLYPPQPNPFTAKTTIAFDLPQASQVQADVYDVQGRRVRRIAEGVWPVGHHLLSWDARDAEGRRVAGGVYFLRVRTGTEDLMQRMVLLR